MDCHTAVRMKGGGLGLMPASLLNTAVNLARKPVSHTHTHTQDGSSKAYCTEALGEGRRKALDSQHQ